MKKTELLVPVGNMDVLYSAIYNGADAVYLGGKRFGARAFSNNFDEDEMVRAIKLCHLYGVKIYVAVNTMIYQNEVEDFINYIDFLYRNNIDAVIMQDIGMINLVRSKFPNLEVHVSTQAHNHNNEGISYFKSIGCTRVVFAREESLDAINSIDVDIEKEVFVYGALCVSYSGNCLFSSMNGGRSGNRGECSQCCRLPYSLYSDNKFIKDGYLLSTKDLNTLDRLKDLLDSNIDSLKIEGRMKSKEYVACVTKIFRKLIDAYYSGKEMIVSDQDRINLLKLFNREFTLGYLFDVDSIINSSTSNHQGILIGSVVKIYEDKIKVKLSSDIHQEDGIRFKNSSYGMVVNRLYNDKGLLINSASSGDFILLDKKANIICGDDVLKTTDYLLLKELNSYDEKKINITMSFKAILGSMQLVCSDGINSVEVSSNNVYGALKQPITKDRILEQLSKLGSTPFISNSINIELEENLFINIKDINELRRSAIDLLISKRENSSKEIVYGEDINLPITICDKSNLSVLVRNEEQLLECIKYNVDVLYTDDYSLYSKYKGSLNIYYRLERVKHNFEDFKNERLLCSELGSVYKYSSSNDVRVDYFMNVSNDYSIDAYKKLGVSSMCLSCECNQDRFNYINDKDTTEILVYGYVENMVIKNDLLGISGSTNSYLKDIKNKKYNCYFDGELTHIFSSDPIDNFDILPYLKGFKYYRIELLNEDRNDVAKLLSRFNGIH